MPRRHRVERAMPKKCNAWMRQVQYQIEPRGRGIDGGMATMRRLIAPLRPRFRVAWRITTMIGSQMVRTLAKSWRPRLILGGTSWRLLLLIAVVAGTAPEARADFEAG
ncbi:MAG: hypothetical protein ACI8PT_004259, partial [Gammaproteobacteria bacterium]